MNHRRTLEWLTLGNYAETLPGSSCPGVEFLSFPPSCVAIALPFPQFALLHSVPRVHPSLITILGNCGCQFPRCVLALTFIENLVRIAPYSLLPRKHKIVFIFPLRIDSAVCEHSNIQINAS
jgi:hypothetical protein